MLGSELLHLHTRVHILGATEMHTAGRQRMRNGEGGREGERYDRDR